MKEFIIDLNCSGYNYLITTNRTKNIFMTKLHYKLLLIDLRFIGNLFSPILIMKKAYLLLVDIIT